MSPSAENPPDLAQHARPAGSAAELGNSNRGHSFEGKETDKRKLPSGVIGPELTDAERDALIAYLKKL